ncbi:MAG: hypothetical protein V3R57_09945, partial [Candidatus Bathyarchaeia archaeon]
TTTIITAKTAKTPIINLIGFLRVRLLMLLSMFLRVLLSARLLVRLRDLRLRDLRGLISKSYNVS